MPVTIDDQVYEDLEAAIKAAKPTDKLVVSVLSPSHRCPPKLDAQPPSQRCNGLQRSTPSLQADVDSVRDTWWP